MNRQIWQRRAENSRQIVRLRKTCEHRRQHPQRADRKKAVAVAASKQTCWSPYRIAGPGEVMDIVFLWVLKNCWSSGLTRSVSSVAAKFKASPFSLNSGISESSIKSFCRSKFRRSLPEYPRVQINVRLGRRRAHQRHVVKRRQQHSAIQSVQMQETL